MKKAIALLLAGIICVSMYGCSGNTKESAELQKEDAKTTGMGRYVEKTVLEPDGNDGPVQIQELSDGTLVYFDTLWKYVSKDNGETWNKEETNWLYELNEDNYFIDSAIAKDGNILMEYENFSDIENSEVETEQKAKFPYRYAAALAAADSGNRMPDWYTVCADCDDCFYFPSVSAA